MIQFDHGRAYARDRLSATHSVRTNAVSYPTGLFLILWTVTTLDADLQGDYRGPHETQVTDEYKAEAVRCVVSSGQPVAEVAGNLGIVEATLERWVAKAREQ